MTLASPSVRPPGPLREQLRQSTAEAHEQLEQSLDLVGRVCDRRRFERVLERFLGFHIAWEQAIRARPAVRAFHAPRTRLPHLRRDLAALGRTNAEMAALPVCREAASLADGDAAAVGSIYVMEGSTLGGQVISRALAKADWAPAGGLTYFNPYASRTGAMWRDFAAWAEGAVQPEARAAAVDGANRTFATLRAWLTT